MPPKHDTSQKTPKGKALSHAPPVQTDELMNEAENASDNEIENMQGPANVQAHENQYVTEEWLQDMLLEMQQGLMKIFKNKRLEWNQAEIQPTKVVDDN